MCLFPRFVKPNTPAYRAGMREFSCGCCPECLSRKSRYWALRACMEAKVSPGYMVTLTYDQFIRDKRGNVIGELPPDSSRRVSKRDCQLFIKRLRRFFPNQTIKYICTAEYGSHTHRAHYHFLIFGIVLRDLIIKGKSKRGNLIYRSPTISRIWANAPVGTDWRTLPICTVDAVAVGPAVARYCTKYCSKDSGRDGGDDTFMLFSRGIGEKQLLSEFNGKFYVIDGCEYPIPRTIWQSVISEKYGCSFRYVRPQDDRFVHYWQYHNPINGRFQRHSGYFYQDIRRYALDCKKSDPDYQAYLKYWKDKSDLFELNRPSSFDRIVALPDDKYRLYKVACLRYINKQDKFMPRLTPKRRSHLEHVMLYGSLYALPSSAVSACHKTADDTDYRLRGFKCVDYDVLASLDCPFPP